MILADDCSIRSSSLPGIGNRFRWGKRFKGGPPRSDALFGLAPRGVCTAVAVARNAVSSYLTFSPLPRPLRGRGGIFSVALSVAFRWRKPAIERPAVSRHAALWSSDVPLLRPRWFGGNSGCPTHSGCLNCQRSSLPACAGANNVTPLPRLAEPPVLPAPQSGGSVGR